MSVQYPYGPMRSVSKATTSPSAMTRGPHSWNHGLVRGPEVRSRVSIHSPPRLTFSAWRIAQRSFSVIPGRIARRISSMLVSQAAIAQRMAATSFASLILRACSVTRCPSRMSIPSRSKARTPAISILSTARRRLPPPCARSRSSTSAAKRPASSSVRSPVRK